jgi:hypothetical protein
VARPRLEAKTFRAVVPLAFVNVLNLVCGLVGEGRQCNRSELQPAVAYRHHHTNCLAVAKAPRRPTPLLHVRLQALVV